MTTSSYTPGPWKVMDFDGSRDAHWFPIRAETVPYVAMVAEVAGMPTPNVETQANARLIAAAPELVAALEELQTQVQNVMERGLVEILGMDFLRDAMDASESLLARIKGESNE